MADDDLAALHLLPHGSNACCPGCTTPYTVGDEESNTCSKCFAPLIHKVDKRRMCPACKCVMAIRVVADDVMEVGCSICQLRLVRNVGDLYFKVKPNGFVPTTKLCTYCQTQTMSPYALVCENDTCGLPFDRSTTTLAHQIYMFQTIDKSRFRQICAKYQNETIYGRRLYAELTLTLLHKCHSLLYLKGAIMSVSYEAVATVMQGEVSKSELWWHNRMYPHTPRQPVLQSFNHKEMIAATNVVRKIWTSYTGLAAKSQKERRRTLVDDVKEILGANEEGNVFTFRQRKWIVRQEALTKVFVRQLKDQVRQYGPADVEQFLHNTNIVKLTCDEKKQDARAIQHHVREVAREVVANQPPATMPQHVSGGSDEPPAQQRARFETEGSAGRASDTGALPDSRHLGARVILDMNRGK